MTCAVGRFEVPGYEALGAALVIEPDRGAVAVWAPTGLSYNDEARTLNQAFVQAALVSRDRRLLGDAILQGLEAYAGSGYFPFMMRIYNLLGDPALRIK